MLVSSKQILLNAREGNYAVVAPDFFDNNSARDYVAVAEEMGKPIILSFAQAHMEMLSVEEAATIGKFYGERAKTEVVLHLDPGQDFETIKKAIDNGFTSVMIDASFKPFEENVALTKQVVEYAHAHGVTVEAEIGHVGTGETYGSENNDSVYTEVDMAVKFVELTNVDSLAVSIGTAHGKYKGTPVINFERLHQLREAVKVPLVLHGGSGSGEDNLRRCSTEGISKINIFTDFISAASDAVAANENIKNWFDLLHTADEGIKKTLRYYYNLFDVNK